MPRPPRGSSFAEEYRRRKERTQGLPTPVQRGHGPVRIKVARQLEEERRLGRRKRGTTLPQKTRERLRRTIVKYQKNYWGGIKTGHRISQTFESREIAEEVLEQNGIPLEYATIREEGGRWVIVLQS